MPTALADTFYTAILTHTRQGETLLRRVQASGLILDPALPVDEQSLRDLRNRARASSPEPMAQIRRLRNAALLAIAERDLTGQSDLQENLESISLLAELCTEMAYRASLEALIERHGRPLNATGQPVDLLIIGMGKLGGRELNASSDVDLIPILPEDGETEGRPGGGGAIDLQTFFTKVTRQVSGLLSEVTGDGFAFRVDLRLRPNGSSGPVVHTLGMLEDYLVVQGREWERYAWTKARVVNPPVCMTPDAFAQAVQQLEDIRLPFVFRRYLDYNALAALRDLHRQIREEANRRALRDCDWQSGCHPVVDVKLGRGGIREVEFIAQLFQLIRGGRDPSLQLRGTRETLEILSRQGRLLPSDVMDLQAAYAFWRRLEHRLQYWEDAQTHVLTGDAGLVSAMEAAMGLSGEVPGEALHAAIEHHQSVVEGHFERLFRSELNASNGGETPLANDRDSRLARLQTAIEQRAARSADPDQLAKRLQALIDSLSRRASYLALFDEYPEALDRVARVLEASEWAASYLQKHPIVLDELLDPRTLMEQPDFDGFRRELQAQLAAAVRGGEPDVERQMDLLREGHHAALFRLLVQDLSGVWTVERLSDQLSRLADEILSITLEAAWAASPRRHRETPCFAVVAYGRLGGKELGYASDLDLIFLHDDPHELAQERYARLAQRMNVWLSTQTAAGSLFEIDLRLRPNGNAGLLVSDLSGFLEYQTTQAWVWEHQALTRARFCAGSAQIGEAFEAGRRQILCLPREPEPLLEEILAMRTRMAEGHPNPSGRFDLKHDQGGMVDIEFMVQALVLRYAHQHPSLTQNLGNIALLGMAGQLGLIPPDLAEAVGSAYRTLRANQHRIRLTGAGSARMDTGSLRAEREAVRALWSHVFRDAPATIRPLSEIHGRNR